jgi:hypothetical protein
MEDNLTVSLSPVCDVQILTSIVPAQQFVNAFQPAL